ncbi:RTC4-like domain-containing protein [Schizophyllum fasciatum]
MNRNPSLSGPTDASTSRLYKLPARNTTEPTHHGIQRGRGRDGREDLAMPKPKPAPRKPLRKGARDNSGSDDELEHPYGADISANRITRTASPPTPEELDPTYQQMRSNAYKNLSFKKKSKAGDASSAPEASTSKAPAEPIDLTAQPDSPKKRRPASPPRRPLRHEATNARGSPPRRVPSPPSPITHKPQRNRFAKSRAPAANKRQPEADPSKNPFGLTKARPPSHDRHAQRHFSPPSSQAASIVIDDNDGSTSGGVEEVNGPDDEEEAAYSRSLRKRGSMRLNTPEAAPFPMDLTPRKKLQPQAFPMSDDSPLSSPPQRKLDSFPMLSPLSSQTRPEEEDDADSDGPCFPPVKVLNGRFLDKGKGKAPQDAPKLRAKPVRRPQPPPFSQAPPSSRDDSHTPRSNKRFSDDGPGENERRSKKHRSQSPNESVHDDDPDLSLRPASIDARELCPYCDELLPPSPTPTLTRMLEEVAKKSRPAPRPSNPRGRKAQLRHFVIVCQRHRFERDVLPEAERKGWPKEIDWGALPARVRGLRDGLQRVLEDGAGHAGCVFWEELAREIREKGTRATTGVAGQFENFEKVQIGYYGEQGAAIITQTLYSMFPMDLIDPETVAPLSAGEFLQRVLLPEAGLRLIAEDRGRGARDALRTLRESARYGVAMFPDDAGVGGRAGGQRVADGIVRARAARRRQQIEAEERKEEEEAAAAARARPRPKPRPVRREATGSSVDMDALSVRAGSDVEMDMGGASSDVGGPASRSSDVEMETDVGADSDVDGWLRRQRPAGPGGEQEETPKPARRLGSQEPTRQSQRIPRLRPTSARLEETPKRSTRSRSASAQLAANEADDAEVIELSSQDDFGDDNDDNDGDWGKGKRTSQRSKPANRRSKPTSRRKPPSRQASRAGSVASDSSSSVTSNPAPRAKGAVAASGLAAGKARMAARQKSEETKCNWLFSSPS